MDRSTFTWVRLGSKWITAFWHHNSSPSVADQQQSFSLSNNTWTWLLEIIYEITRRLRKGHEFPDLQPHSSVSLCFSSRSIVLMKTSSQREETWSKGSWEGQDPRGQLRFRETLGWIRSRNQKCELEWTALMDSLRTCWLLWFLGPSALK